MDLLGHKLRMIWLFFLVSGFLTGVNSQKFKRQAQYTNSASTSSYGSIASTLNKYCPTTKCIVVNDRLYFADGTPSRPLTASEEADIKAAKDAQNQSLNQSVQQYQQAYNQWRTAFNANGGNTEQKPPMVMPQTWTSVQMPVAVVNLNPGSVLQWEGMTITGTR